MSIDGRYIVRWIAGPKDNRESLFVGPDALTEARRQAIGVVKNGLAKHDRAKIWHLEAVARPGVPVETPPPILDYAAY